MKKLKAPRLVTVAVFTTITVIFWVFMGLYNLITSTPPASVDPELLKPINPVLDQEALNRIEGRVYFKPGETTSPVIFRETPEANPETEEILIPEEEIISETATPTASLSE
jgi:hypothetical protein